MINKRKEKEEYCHNCNAMTQNAKFASNTEVCRYCGVEK